jgi:hypothetical protein
MIGLKEKLFDDYLYLLNYNYRIQNVYASYCFRKPNGTGHVQGNHHTYETHGNNGGYATADGILSPDPPPYV